MGVGDFGYCWGIGKLFVDIRLVDDFDFGVGVIVDCN